MPRHRHLDTVTRCDSYDREQFENILKVSGSLLELKKRGEAELKTFKGLMQDFYNILYKIRPQILKNTPHSLSLNKEIVKQMLTTTDYQRLHKSTMLDEFASAIGVNKLGHTVLSTLSQEQKETINQMVEAESQLEGYQQLLSQLEKTAAKTQPNPNIENHIQRVKAKVQDLSSKLSQLKQSLNLPKGKLRRQLRKALQDAQKEAQESQEMLSWGVEPGQLQNLPVEKKFEIANRIANSSKLQQIAKIAGRFQRLALHKQQTKVTHGRDEVVDVETGNDLARVLPSELVLLRNPKTKLLFYKKFAEGQLLQYRLEGLEKTGKGPMIVCIDNSGSMDTYFGGVTREVWAKAVALGLLTIAKHQKRSFAVVHFGSSSECKTFYFPKGKVNIDDLLDWLKFFYNGGTDFERPLRESLHIIEQEQDFKKADIVFITDGECEVSESFLQMYQQLKNKWQFQTLSILVGYKESTLKQFSDKVFQVYDTEDEPEVLSEIFSI